MLCHHCVDKCDNLSLKNGKMWKCWDIIEQMSEIYLGHPFCFKEVLVSFFSLHLFITFMRTLARDMRHHFLWRLLRLFSLCFMPGLWILIWILSVSRNSGLKSKIRVPYSRLKSVYSIFTIVDLSVVYIYDQSTCNRFIKSTYCYSCITITALHN
mgnify:CR=1 FL=1